MKKLIIAGITGMICFQSCTKENKILPLNTQKNLPEPSSLVYSKKTTETNWCGTIISVSKTTSKDEISGQTPPIYIPRYESVSK